MAVMGLYRNMGAFLSVTVALGFGTVIVQRVSISRSPEQLGQIGWASIILLGIQGMLMVALAVLAAPGLAGWIFSGPVSDAQVRDVRIVVLAAFINIALQLSRNILNRTEHLKALSIIQIATAASSLALIYPLMKLGSLGLAINVASGGVIGLGLSAIYFWKAYESHLRSSRPTLGLEFLSSSFRPSLPFVLQAIVSIGSLLAIQATVSRGYGLLALGLINAAMLITDTLGMVIVAPVKSFFLPEFSALSDELSMEKYFSRMMGALLCLGIIASVGVLVGSRFAVALLFSADFDAATSLSAICGLSLIGQALAWSYHLILLNKLSNRVIVALDASWSLGVLALVVAAIRFKLPISAVAWAYALGYSLYGVISAVTVSRLYGRRWVSNENYQLLAVGGASVLVCYGLSTVSFPACVVGCLVLAFAAARRLASLLQP